jgi:hypothetical protein
MVKSYIMNMWEGDGGHNLGPVETVFIRSKGKVVPVLN